MQSVTNRSGRKYVRERIERQNSRQLQSRGVIAFSINPGWHRIRLTLFCIFFWCSLILTLQFTAFSQVLTPELLASVAIEPLVPSNKSYDISGKCAPWRNVLLFPDSKGENVVVVDIDKRAVIGSFEIPSLLQPLRFLTWASEADCFAGIVGNPDHYSFCRFRIRGTVKGGYRADERGVRVAQLQNPDGTYWRSGKIESFALSPDGNSFWLGVCSKEKPPRRWLWRFQVTENRTDLAAMTCHAAEMLDLEEAVGEVVGSIGGMVWWPRGLLLVLNSNHNVDLSRSGVKLLFFEWGAGRAPTLIASKVARSYVATDLGDSPTALYLILRSQNRNTPLFVAKIPKLYPAVR